MTADPGDYAARLAALAGELEAPRRDVPLAPYTTFRLGGPADLFFAAATADALAHAVTAARRHGVPYFRLGLGANVLIGDRGFRGLVIRNRARHATLAGNCLTAESGAVVHPDLIELTVAHGLSGLEHFAGIPSTVGGALWQNLHFLSPARDRTVFIAEVTTAADLLDADGRRHTATAADLAFGYDTSILHHRPDTVLTATFDLAAADPAALRHTIAENLAWRAARHPPLDTEPSAGSIFQKIDGIGAGRLIEESGLKGVTRGGAQVTHRHANIIINRGHATAADVRALIDHIQAEVARRTGHHLHPEIQFIGDF